MSTRLDEHATTPRKPMPITFEEWLTWDQEGGLSEWMDGEVVQLMPATELHQRLVGFLDRLIGLFAQIYRLGEVRTGPYAMRAVPGKAGREPDVMFIATENLARMQNDYLHGPADLVVEIISEDSLERDRATKFYEYQDAGVREYWIIDPRPNWQRVDFYLLDEAGRYQPIPIGSDGTYHSTVVGGFWLRIDWLWQDEPDALRALSDIVGPERLMAALQRSTP